LNIGPIEIVVVLVLALLVFGPSRLPQMGKSLGRGIREFRKAADTAKSELGLDEVTDQIKSVKSSVDDLKSSVDLKAAVEAPLKTAPAAASAAGAAGAALAATPGAKAPETAEDVPESAGTDVAAAATTEGETGADAPVPPETPAAPEPPDDPDAGSPQPAVDAAPGS